MNSRWRLRWGESISCEIGNNLFNVVEILNDVTYSYVLVVDDDNVFSGRKLQIFLTWANFFCDVTIRPSERNIISAKICRRLPRSRYYCCYYSCTKAPLKIYQRLSGLLKALRVKALVFVEPVEIWGEGRSPEWRFLITESFPSGNLTWTRTIQICSNFLCGEWWVFRISHVLLY